MIQQVQLQLKEKGEKIICQFHKQPTNLLNIGKNVALGERLICEGCSTITKQVLQLNEAEEYLFNMYQEEKSTIEEQYLQSKLYTDKIDKIAKSCQALFKEFQKKFEKLIDALTQQIQNNKERFNKLIEQKSKKTKLSQLIENIAGSQELTDQTLQQIAELISNQNIVNGKIQLKEKIQISDSSTQAIQEQNERICACLGSINDLLARQQNLLDYDKFNYASPIQLEGHEKPIRDVAISNDDQLMASGDYDGLILVWQLDSKSLKQQYNGEQQIQELIFSPNNKLLAATQFNSPFDILIFNLCTPSKTSPFMRLKGHTLTACRFVFTSNSKFMISGSWDYTLRIWSLGQQKCVVNQKLTNIVYGVNISQDQQYISACCSDGYAYLFNSTNIVNPKEMAKWNAHKVKAYGTTFTPDSKMLLTCGQQDIKLWSIAQLLLTDQQKSFFRVYKTEKDGSEFWSIQTRLNGSILISNDDKIRIWNIESGKLMQTLIVPEGFQYIEDRNFSVSRHMKYIITGGKNGKLKVYELQMKAQ